MGLVYAEEPKDAPVTDEIATAAKDIDIFAGYLGTLPNPDPVLLSRGGGRGLRLYDEIARDPHARSVLDTRYLSVAGLEWTVYPADAPKRRGRQAAGTREQEIADFVTQALLNCNLSQCCAEILRAVLYGFYVAEVMWKIDPAGAVVPARFITKHPRRFCFTEDRELRLLTPQSMITGEPVPDRKFIVLTWGDSDNPWGFGLGQSMWWPVWFKKNGMKFWMTFLERFGHPTTVGYYPPGTTPAQQKALLDALDAIQKETCIKLPDTMKIAFLEATRQGEAGFLALEDHCNAEISKCVGGQTASADGTPGKLGGDDAQDNVRQDRIKADADLLAEVFNQTIVRWIVDLNFMGVTTYPTIWFDAGEAQDLAAEANRDQVVIRGIGLEVPKGYLREKYGYPEPKAGEETVGGLAPAPAPAFAEAPSRRFPPRQQAVEDLADATAAEAAQALAGNEDAIVAAVQGATDFNDAFQRVLDLYPAMDISGMEDAMNRAILNANLYGRATAAEDAGA